MVLALSCMPCMDDAYAMNNGKAKAEVSKSATPQEHNDTDNCSPFCACNCCAGFTFLFAPYKTKFPVLLSAEKFAYHLPAKITNVALPIWQPPQLV